MEFVDSLKNGGKLVSYNGYLYRRDKEHKTTINWRCTIKGCKGRLITSAVSSTDEIPYVRGEHCHLPNPSKVEVKKLHSRLKEKATATADVPRKIIRDEVQTLSQEAATQVGTNRNLAAIINRKRRRVQHLPPAPSSRTGFVLPIEYTVTSSGEQFLLFDSGVEDENRILIFGTKRMVEFMTGYKQWFIDGTFKVCPDIFYQLFTVHVLVQDNVLPCLYGLLPNKSKDTYCRFWEGLRNNTEEYDMQPVSVVTDFELASVQAFKEYFPNAIVTGCYFHLGQSVWRHVQRFGLYDSYITNENVRTNIKSILALAFLPVDDVPDSFDELTENFTDELQPICNYFEDVYIGRHARRSRRQPCFPPSMWNMYDRLSEGLPRTNNSVEIWHSLSGSRPLYKEACYKRVNEALKLLFQQRNNMPLLDYLRGCSYNIEMNK